MVTSLEEFLTRSAKDPRLSTMVNLARSFQIDPDSLSLESLAQLRKSLKSLINGTTAAVNASTDPRQAAWRSIMSETIVIMQALMNEVDAVLVLKNANLADLNRINRIKSDLVRLRENLIGAVGIGITRTNDQIAALEKELKILQAKVGQQFEPFPVFVPQPEPEPIIMMPPDSLPAEQVFIQLPTDSNVAPEAGVHNDNDVNFQEAFVPEEFGRALETSIDIVEEEKITSMETSRFGEIGDFETVDPDTGRLPPTEFTPAQKAQGFGFPLLLLLFAGEVL